VRIDEYAFVPAPGGVLAIDGALPHAGDAPPAQLLRTAAHAELEPGHAVRLRVYEPVDAAGTPPERIAVPAPLAPPSTAASRSCAARRVGAARLARSGRGVGGLDARAGARLAALGGAAERRRLVQGGVPALTTSRRSRRRSAARACCRPTFRRPAERDALLATYAAAWPGYAVAAAACEAETYEYIAQSYAGIAAAGTPDERRLRFASDVRAGKRPNPDM
jgi:hypothetical protein